MPEPKGTIRALAPTTNTSPACPRCFTFDNVKAGLQMPDGYRFCKVCQRSFLPGPADNPVDYTDLPFAVTLEGDK